VRLFEASRPAFRRRQVLLWHGFQQTAAIGRLGLPGEGIAAVPAVVIDLSWPARPEPRAPGQDRERPLPPLAVLAGLLPQGFLARGGDGPIGPLLLAIRSARRAIATDPDDYRPYLVLGQAYLHLARQTGERSWARPLPMLARLRQVQAITQFHLALRLRPDLGAAREGLLQLYRDSEALDLAQQQAEELLRLTRAAGPTPGQPPADFEERLAGLGKLVDFLGQEVERRSAAVKPLPGRNPIVTEAEAAVRAGLPRRALDILLASDVSAFGPAGLYLELDLLLTAGRIRDFHNWSSPDQEGFIGTANYRRLHTLADAALGKYDQVDQDLAALADLFPPPRPGQVPLDALRERLAATFAYNVLSRTGPDQSSLLNQLAAWGRELAGSEVLRGLLAAEAGDAPRAEAAFRRALAVWQGSKGLDFPGRPAAEFYLRKLTAGQPEPRDR
jgi:tetratricopeptide (TPR) repeat protein